MESILHILGLCPDRFSHMTIWHIFGWVGTFFVVISQYFQVLKFKFLSLFNKKSKKKKIS